MTPHGKRPVCACPSHPLSYSRVISVLSVSLPPTVMVVVVHVGVHTGGHAAPCVPRRHARRPAPTGPTRATDHPPTASGMPGPSAEVGDGSHGPADLAAVDMLVRRPPVAPLLLLLLELKRLPLLVVLK